MATTTEDLLVRIRADVGDALRKLRDVQAETKKTGTEVAKTGTSFRGSNQLLVDFGRGLNDAQQFQYSFQQGLIAVSNQFDGLIMNFREAIKQGGGFRGAMRSIAASMLGPGGLIVGINLALTAIVLFGDKLGAVFGTAKQDAEEVKERLDDLIGSIVEFNNTPLVFRLDTAAIQRILPQLEQRLADARARLASGDQAARFSGGVPDGLAGILGQREVARLQRYATEQAALGVSLSEAEREELEGQVQVRERLIAQFREQLEVARDLERIQQELQGAGGAPEPRRRAAATRQQIRDAETVADAIAAMRRGLDEARGAFEAGLLTPLELAEERAELLERGARRALAVTGGALTDEIRAVADEAQRARRNLVGMVPTEARGIGGDIEGAAGAVRTVNQALSDLARGPGPLAIDLLRGLREGALSASLAVGDGLAAAFGRLVSMQDTFADFGRSIVRSLQQMVAAFTEAIARALIFRGIVAALNLFAPGVGKFVGGALGLAGGGGMKFAPLPTQAASLQIGAGQMRVTGGALVGLIRAELAAEAASGRGSGGL